MEKEHALQFVTVALRGQDSSLVKGAVTDADGKYLFDKISRGQYFLEATMIGYTKISTQPIVVDMVDTTMPDIILNEASVELGEVVVKADKAMFEQQIDRLVMNVQGSITSAGNTVLELLQKSPGVVVNKQNNTININGRSGVRVMINDKMMQLPIDVVIQMLDGMNAANVERIEFITAPGAKYDADGTAGIIHIVTKKDTELGTNGSFGLTLGAHWAETLGGNFNISHRGRKTAYFIDYGILRNHNLHRANLYSEAFNNNFLQTTSDISHRENVTMQQNLSAGFEWTPAKNTTVSVQLMSNSRDWELDATNSDVNRVRQDSVTITDVKIHESNIWRSVAGGVGVQTKINSKSEINFNADYLYYNNNNPSNYNNNSFYEQENKYDVSKIDLKKNTPIEFFIAKTDYRYSPSASFSLETGIKGVISRLSNDVFVQRMTNNVWAIDPVFTSYSNLREKIGAAYVSSQWTPANKWQVNTGLRYEYTHTTISTREVADLINRKYGYFFPNISIRKTLADDRDLQISYTRRLTRPTYNDIAPYVFFWGMNTFLAGNTALWPAVSDAIKAEYRLGQWNMSVQHSHSSKEITSYQPEKDVQSGNLIYRSQNLTYANVTAVTSSYSFSPAPWWEVQSNITAQHQVAQTSYLPNNVRLRLYGVNINAVNLFKLGRDFSVEISGFYQSTLLVGTVRYLSQASLNAGIQKKMGDKGTLQLAMDDILNTNYWRIVSDLPQNNLNTLFKYNFHNQFVRLTYTRKFGDNKLRSVKPKSASDEERRRVSN